jgi:hypothetical protein
VDRGGGVACASTIRRGACSRRESTTLGAVSRQLDTAASPVSTKLERALIALGVLALYSITPPYLGPLLGLELDVSSKVEVIDHVIPGVSAAIAAWIALSYARRGQTDSVAMLAALGLCVLAGLFQAVSHLTLVLNAGDPQAPVGSVILHATPGPALLILSLVLLLRPAPG